MAQQLRVNNDIAEAPSLVLSSHFWLLTTTHKTSSQGSPLGYLQLDSPKSSVWKTIREMPIDCMFGGWVGL